MGKKKKDKNGSGCDTSKGSRCQEAQPHDKGYSRSITNKNQPNTEARLGGSSEAKGPGKSIEGEKGETIWFSKRLRSLPS